MVTKTLTLTLGPCPLKGSWTKRTHDKTKKQGNIVCFRNLKDKTDEAITLFSNKEAIDEVIVEPYEKYVALFKEAVNRLSAIARTKKGGRFIH